MMTEYNISCTIANDLLRDNPPNADEYNLVADVVAFMIEHAIDIFGVCIIFHFFININEIHLLFIIYYYN